MSVIEYLLFASVFTKNSYISEKSVSNSERNVKDNDNFFSKTR